eukprot:jgi/Mesvir1/17670/Mv01369-RA.1
MEARGVESCRKLQLAGQEHCDDVDVLFNLVEPGIVAASNASWAITTKTALVKGICGCGKQAQAPREFSAGTYVASAGEELARIALPQWKNAALSTVASSYLKVFFCEHELLYNVAELVREIQSHPNPGVEADNLLLAWLDSLLESLQSASAARSVYTLTQAALLIGRLLLDRANEEGIAEARSDHLHLGIMRCVVAHPGVHSCGILAIVQPPARLLPHALELLQFDPANGIGWLIHGPPGGSSATSHTLEMTAALLSQLPWDSTTLLGMPPPILQTCLLPSLMSALESLGSAVRTGGLTLCASSGSDALPTAPGAPARRVPPWEPPARLLLVLARTTLRVGRAAHAYAAAVRSCVRALGWLPSPVRAATAPLLCSLPLPGTPALVGSQGAGTDSQETAGGRGQARAGGEAIALSSGTLEGGADTDVSGLDHALVQLLVATLGLWQPTHTPALTSPPASALQNQLSSHAVSPSDDGQVTPSLTYGHDQLSMDSALALVVSHACARAHEKALPREWLAARCLEECSLLAPALREAAAKNRATGGASGPGGSGGQGGVEAPDDDKAFPSLRLLARVADMLMWRLDALARADARRDGSTDGASRGSGGSGSSGGGGGDQQPSALDAATMAELVATILDELAHLALFWGVDPGTRFDTEQGREGGFTAARHAEDESARAVLTGGSQATGRIGDQPAGSNGDDRTVTYDSSRESTTHLGGGALGTPLAVSTSPIEAAFDEANQRAWMGQPPSQGAQGGGGPHGDPRDGPGGGVDRRGEAPWERAGAVTSGSGWGHPARQLQVPALDPLIHEAASRQLSRLCAAWPTLVGHVLATLSRHAGAYALGAWPSDRVLALVTALPLRRWHPFAKTPLSNPPSGQRDATSGQQATVSGPYGTGVDQGEAEKGRERAVAAKWFSKCDAGGLLGLLVMAGVAPDIIAQVRASSSAFTGDTGGSTPTGGAFPSHQQGAGGDAVPPWGTVAAWAQVATQGVSYEGAARMGGGHGGDGPARVAAVVVMAMKFGDIVAGPPAPLALPASTASSASSMPPAWSVSFRHRPYALLLLAATRHVVPRDWWLQALLGRGRGQALTCLSAEELASVTGEQAQAHVMGISEVAVVAAQGDLLAWLATARWVASLPHDGDGDSSGAGNGGRVTGAGRGESGRQQPGGGRGSTGGAPAGNTVPGGHWVPALSGMPRRSAAEVKASAQLWDMARAVASLGLVETAVALAVTDVGAPAGTGVDASRCLGTGWREALGLGCGLYGTEEGLEGGEKTSVGSASALSSKKVASESGGSRQMVLASPAAVADQLLSSLRLFDLLESVLLLLARRRMADAATGGAARADGGGHESHAQPPQQHQQGAVALGEHDMLLVLASMQLLFRLVRNVLVPTGLADDNYTCNRGDANKPFSTSTNHAINSKTSTSDHDGDSAYVTRVARVLRLCLELGEDAAMLPIRHRVARSLGGDSAPVVGSTRDNVWSEARLGLRALVAAMMLGGGEGAPRGGRAPPPTQQEPAWRRQQREEVDFFLSRARHGARVLLPDLLNDLVHGLYAAAGGPWVFGLPRPALISSAGHRGGAASSAVGQSVGQQGGHAGAAGEVTRVAEALLRGQRGGGGSYHWLAVMGMHLQALRWWPARDLRPPSQNRSHEDASEGVQGAGEGSEGAQGEGVEGKGSSGLGVPPVGSMPGGGMPVVTAAELDDLLATAFACQEMAMRLGQHPAALPLWEEFGVCFRALLACEADPDKAAPSSSTPHAAAGGGASQQFVGEVGATGQGEGLSPPTPSAGEGLEEPTLLDLGGGGGGGAASLAAVPDDGRARMSVLADDPFSDIGTKDGTFVLEDPEEMSTLMASQSPASDPLLVPRGGGNEGGLPLAYVMPPPTPAAVAAPPLGTYRAIFETPDVVEHLQILASFWGAYSAPLGDLCERMARFDFSPVPSTAEASILPKGVEGVVPPPGMVPSVSASGVPVTDARRMSPGWRSAAILSGDPIAFRGFCEVAPPRLAPPRREQGDAGAAGGADGAHLARGPQGRASEDLTPGAATAVAADSIKREEGAATRVVDGQGAAMRVEAVGGHPSAATQAGGARPGDSGVLAGAHAPFAAEGDILVHYLLPRRVDPVSRAACEAGARLPQYLALRERVQGASRDLVAWAAEMGKAGACTPEERALWARRMVADAVTVGSIKAAAQGVGEGQVGLVGSGAGGCASHGGTVGPLEGGGGQAAALSSPAGADTGVMPTAAAAAGGRGHEPPLDSSDGAPVALPSLARTLRAALARVDDFSRAVADLDARLLRLVRGRYTERNVIVNVRLCCLGERGTSADGRVYVVPCPRPNVLPVEHPEMCPGVAPEEYERQFAACRCACRDLLLRLLDGPVQALGFLCFEIESVARWLLHHAAEEKGMGGARLSMMMPSPGTAAAYASGKPAAKDKGKGKATVDIVEASGTGVSMHSGSVARRAPPTPDALAAAELFFGLLEVALMPSEDSSLEMSSTGTASADTSYITATTHAVLTVATAQATTAKPSVREAAASEGSRLVLRAWARGLLSLLADAAVPSQPGAQERLICRLGWGHAWVDATVGKWSSFNPASAGNAAHATALSVPAPRPALGANSPGDPLRGASCADLAAFLISEHTLAPHLLLADAPDSLPGLAGSGGQGSSGGIGGSEGSSSRGIGSGGRGGAVTGGRGEQGSRRAMLLLACLRGLALRAAQAAGASAAVLPPFKLPASSALVQKTSEGAAIGPSTPPEDGGIMRGAMVTWAGVGREQLARLMAEFNVRAVTRQLARAGRLVLPRGSVLGEEEDEESGPGGVHAREGASGSAGGGGGRSQFKILITPEMAMLLEVMQLLFLAGPPASAISLDPSFAHVESISLLSPTTLVPPRDSASTAPTTLSASGTTVASGQGGNNSGDVATTTQQAMALLEELLAFPELLLPCLHALFSDRVISAGVAEVVPLPTSCQAHAGTHAEAPPSPAHHVDGSGLAGVPPTAADASNGLAHIPATVPLAHAMTGGGTPPLAVSLSATLDGRHGLSALSARLDAPLALISRLPLDELPLSTLVRVFRLLGVALQNGRVASQASLAPLISALLATPAALAVLRGGPAESSPPSFPSSGGAHSGPGLTSSSVAMGDSVTAAGSMAAGVSSAAGGASASAGRLLASAQLAEQLWSAVRLLLAACLDNILPLGSLRGQGPGQLASVPSFLSSSSAAAMSTGTGLPGLDSDVVQHQGEGSYLSALQQQDAHDLRCAEMMTQLDTLLATFLDPPALLVIATTSPGSYPGGPASGALSTMSGNLDNLVAVTASTPPVSPACLARLWHLYESLLQPFLAAAATASGDPPGVYGLFRRHWAALPWGAWVPPCVDPEGLSVSISAAMTSAPSSASSTPSSAVLRSLYGSWGEPGELASVVARLRAHLLHEDGAVMHLLHRLPWHTLVEGVVASGAGQGAAYGEGASLHDNSQPRSTLALQLSLLVIEAYIHHGPKPLPVWMKRLLRRQGGGADIAGKEDSMFVMDNDADHYDSGVGERGVTASEGRPQDAKAPHLRDLLWVSDAGTLVRSLEDGDLLQPLLEGSGSVPGDPGPRLVHVLACLTEAALEHPMSGDHAPSCPGRATAAKNDKPEDSDEAEPARRKACRRQCVELAVAAAVGARSLMFASITAGEDGRQRGSWGGGHRSTRSTTQAGTSFTKPSVAASARQPAAQEGAGHAHSDAAGDATVAPEQSLGGSGVEAGEALLGVGGLPESTGEGGGLLSAAAREHNEGQHLQDKDNRSDTQVVAKQEGEGVNDGGDDDDMLLSPSSCPPVWHLDGNLHAHLVSAVLIPLANTCLPCSSPPRPRHPPHLPKTDGSSPPQMQASPALGGEHAPRTGGADDGDVCQDALRRRLLTLLLTCGEVMPRDPLRASGHLPFGNDLEPLCAPYEMVSDGIVASPRANAAGSSSSTTSSLDQALSAKASQLKAFFKRHIGGGDGGGSMSPEDIEKKKAEAELQRRRQAGGFLGYKPREEASAECVRIQAGVAGLVSHFCRSATPALALALCRVAVGPRGRLLADDSVMAARVLEEALRALFSSFKVSGTGADVTATAVEALGGPPLAVAVRSLAFPSTREAELFAEVCEHQRLGLSLAVTLEWMRLHVDAGSTSPGGGGDGGGMERLDSWRGTRLQWLAAAVLVGKKATSFQPDPLRPFDILPVWYVYLSFVGDRRFQDSDTSSLHTEAMAQFVDRQRQLACSLLEGGTTAAPGATTASTGTGALVSSSGGGNAGSGGGAYLGRTTSDASRTSESSLLMVSTAPGGMPVDSTGRGASAASAAAPAPTGGRFMQGLKQAFAKPVFRSSGNGGGSEGTAASTGKGKDTSGVAVGIDGQPLVTAGGTAANLFGNFANAAAAWGGRLSSAAALAGQGGGLLGRSTSGGEGKGRGTGSGNRDRRASMDTDLAEDGLMDTCLKLAAFAVGAYVHCVLCPPLGSLSALDLGPRPGAGDSGAPGGGSLSRPGSHKPKDVGDGTHEEPLLMELDQLLETRVELDALNQLKQVKMVLEAPEHFEAYFQAMEEVLSSATDLTTFKIRLATSLCPMAPYIASCAL